MSRITDVIGQSNTQHVIHSLLSAYLESLDHLSVTIGLPTWVKRFPIHGLDDVDERLAFFCETVKKTTDCGSWEVAMIREAEDVFGAASSRLRLLELQQDSAPSGWRSTAVDT